MSRASRRWDQNRRQGLQPDVELGQEFTVDGRTHPSAARTSAWAVRMTGPASHPLHRLELELQERAGGPLEQGHTVTGRAESQERARGGEVGEVDGVGSHRHREFREQLGRIEPLVGEVGEVPVRPWPRVTAPARTVQDQQAEAG